MSCSSGALSCRFFQNPQSTDACSCSPAPNPEVRTTASGSPDRVSRMTDLALQDPLTACAMLLFASDLTWDWQRRHMGSISRNAVFLPFAVFVALTANSAIAAAAYPLTFADVLNQF